MATLIILTLIFVAAPLALTLAMRKPSGPQGGRRGQAEENPELLRRPLRSRYPL
jgi:hypothetical protein